MKTRCNAWLEKLPQHTHPRHHETLGAEAKLVNLNLPYTDLAARGIRIKASNTPHKPKESPSVHAKNWGTVHHQSLLDTSGAQGTFIQHSRWSPFTVLCFTSRVLGCRPFWCQDSSSRNKDRKLPRRFESSEGWEKETTWAMMRLPSTPHYQEISWSVDLRSCQLGHIVPSVLRCPDLFWTPNCLVGQKNYRLSFQRKGVPKSANIFNKFLVYIKQHDAKSLTSSYSGYQVPWMRPLSKRKSSKRLARSVWNLQRWWWHLRFHTNQRWPNLPWPKGHHPSFQESNNTLCGAHPRQSPYPTMKGFPLYNLFAKV